MQVEIGIPTRDRYENLALALWTVADQTYQDFKVTIIDDSDPQIDIRKLPYMEPILKRLDNDGHAWRLYYGDKKGPHWSLQKVIIASRCPYVILFDDDSTLDVKCLEYLVEAWKEAEKNTPGKVAAVGPIVMIPGANAEFNTMPVGYKWFKRYNGFMDEYGKCYGDHQWRWHTDDELQECDHLQGFLFDLEKAREIGGFDLNYNITAYRSETDFCYNLFKKGYKLLVQPKALIWHFHSPVGGIRSLNPIDPVVAKGLYDQADDYFLSKFGFKRGKNQNRVIKLSGGLGDHLCATPLLRALKKKGKVVVSAIYPFLFVGNPNVDELIMIPDEKDYKNVDQKNLYVWASSAGFSGKLSEAWCMAYGEEYDGDKLDYVILQPDREWAENILGNDTKPFVLIAPYGAVTQTQYVEIDKTVPSGGKITNIRDWYKDRWESLVKKIQKLGVRVIQVGGLGEEKIEGCDDYHIGINYRLTMALLEKSDGFVGVDSFMQHAGHAIGKKGVILYGPSDPKIGAHDTNINIKSNHCDRDFVCMKQSFPISHWTFKSKDCDSKLCMKSIKVKDVFEQVKVMLTENKKRIGPRADDTK